MTLTMEDRINSLRNLREREIKASQGINPFPLSPVCDCASYCEDIPQSSCARYRFGEASMKSIGQGIEIQIERINRKIKELETLK